jgi:hypothetical protein
MLPDEPRKSRFWAVWAPWLVVAALLGGGYLLMSNTQVTCHYSGDLLSPAARAADKAAEASRQGIKVQDETVEASTPPEKSTKKNRALPMTTTPFMIGGPPPAPASPP